MTKYKESELIINSDGSIYHLKLKPENLADNIIVVGDPQRVSLVSKYFDTIEWKGQNREIITHTGSVAGKHITVLSSGMGTDNMDIVIQELDALVNIDLATRKRKESQKSLNIIRLGTTGAIQPDIPINTFIMAEYGLGLDGLLYFYKDGNNLLESDIADQFIQHSNWPDYLPKPYVARASEELINKLGKGFLKGLTVTAPGFYGPQGRSIRIGLAYPEMNKLIETFEYKGKKITNFEMETSAMYGLSKLLGHNALTICVAIANRALGQHNPNYNEKMEELIQILLERI